MFDKTQSKVFVQPSPIHGLGVFAAQDISVGDVVEVCPLLKLDIDNKNELLADYRFWWGNNGERAFYVIALGYGSIYNHSNNPNAYFFNNEDNFTIDFVATQKIKKGDEVLVDYGGEEYWSSRGYVQVK